MGLFEELEANPDVTAGGAWLLVVWWLLGCGRVSDLLCSGNLQHDVERARAQRRTLRRTLACAAAENAKCWPGARRR